MISVRSAETSDSAAMAAIYNHYVASTVITFEEEPIDAAEIVRRIQVVQLASLPWIVAEECDEVLGYAHAAPWKTRSGYRFSVEITVYVAPGSERRGIGSSLYLRLFSMLESGAFTR